MYIYKDHGHSCTTQLVPDREYCAACYPGKAAMEHIAKKKELDIAGREAIAKVIKAQSKK
jgi:hypothetical protein